MRGIGKIVVSFLVVVSAAGCEKPGSAAPSKEPGRIIVETAPVVAGDYEAEIRVYGTLEPVREATLTALVSGPVESLPVDVGSRVEAGEELFRIREASYRVALQRATAELMRARALAADRIRDRRRLEELFERRVTSEQTRDQARTAAAEAEAAYAEAEAGLAAAELALADARIVAPFGGVVTARFLEPSEFANQGDPVLEIVDLSRLDARVDVPERFAGFLAPGREVSLTAVARSERFGGEIVSVSPKIDPVNRTFPVEVRVENPDGRLQAGLYCEATIRLAVRTGVPSMPATALVRSGGRSEAWVVQGGRAQRRSVRVLGERGEDVFVADGLETGEAVVVVGAGLLYEGAIIDDGS